MSTTLRILFPKNAFYRTVCQFWATVETWRCNMAVQHGGATWRRNMAAQHGGATWRPLGRGPARQVDIKGSN